MGFGKFMPLMFDNKFEKNQLPFLYSGKILGGHGANGKLVAVDVPP